MFSSLETLKADMLSNCDAHEDATVKLHCQNRAEDYVREHGPAYLGKTLFYFL